MSGFDFCPCSLDCSTYYSGGASIFFSSPFIPFDSCLKLFLVLAQGHSRD